MKRSIKNKLKELVITIIIIILSSIIGYIILQNQRDILENVSDEFTKSNIIDSEDISNQSHTINNLIDNTINSTYISDNLPAYSDKIVITINNDIPYFEEKDITTEDFEYYSNLDELNRAGVAFANICKYTMPPEGTKRGSISYKPTGWNQYLYGDNNSKHLYERCHLIAWRLGNENNNKRNLITGTVQMNSAMIEYERQVAKWIEDRNEEGKDYHVLYRITPIYKGENKLATGVQIEAKSVEEKGVLFNKFIYNIQNNFKIDYSTGKAELIEE